MESTPSAVATFRATVQGGELVGTVAGTGARVLLLHGGPMSNYLEPLADELRGNSAVATYQQRGLHPSVTEGPFDVETHIADAIAVLDHLQWPTVVLVGHSWGGHLGLHIMARHRARVAAALLIDTLGAVGDGGYGAFEAEIARRTPPDGLARATELDRRLMDGTATNAEAVESLRIFWPAYFPSPELAPPLPAVTINPAATAATLASAAQQLPALSEQLKDMRIPVSFAYGADSPMPASASTDTAALLGPFAQTTMIDGAGHFVWMDVPGCLQTPLVQLTETVTT